MFETVLVPLSLKESAAAVERMVAALDALGARTVVLLHVHSGPRPGRRERELQSRAAVLREAGYNCRAVVHSGSVAITAVRTANEEECDLIAYPWRRKSWIQRSLVGSVTKDIVRLANIPVFVYKSKRTPPAGEVLSLMYATDFQDTDRAVIPYLKSRRPAGGELMLFHAGERAPDPWAESRRLALVEADLQRLAEECRESGRTVRTFTVVGRPRTAVVRQAHRSQVDVLVIGKADNERALSTMLGSTAEAVAYNARCSVLIFARSSLKEHTRDAG